MACISVGTTVPVEVCAYVHGAPPHTRHACYEGVCLAGATVPPEAARYVWVLVLAPACLCAPQGVCSPGAIVAAELRAVGMLWHALPRVSTRHCAPLGSNSAGATMPSKCAPAELVGCFFLLPMASPLAPSMLNEDNSPPRLPKLHIFSRLVIIFRPTMMASSSGSRYVTR